MLEPETWAAIAFAIFIVVMGYVGAHKAIIASLDQRRDRIKAELDDAQRLKDEALQLLTEYQRRRQQADSEAQDIIAGAKAEAERLAIEAKARVEDFVSRRTKMAEAKIAQAEAQAMSDVRAAAAEAAVSAAEKILTQAAKGKAAEALLAKGIEDVRKKLN
ncbi:MAG TPA: ATP F0F1 synthase subunit B [Pseudolabrys sp.]|nr:ATP F0F1 synthase subunit B [Pseudolabrys sp.]